MIGIKQVGIQKCQQGTSRGGLTNQDYSGTWGDRGKGNELQSAFENGLSWIADKVVNLGDYVEDGLAYLGGLLPGGQTSSQAVQTQRNKREAKPGEQYKIEGFNTYGIKPISGEAPIVPQLSPAQWSKMQQMYRNATKITTGSPQKVVWYRKATDSDDRFLSGISVTRKLEEWPTEYFAHGMAKLSDSELLGNLRMILKYGTDPRKGAKFYSASTKKINPEDKAGLGVGLGTSGGHAYSHGPFMLLHKPGVETTNPNSFTHVLINDGMSQEARELALKYKDIISREFPNIKTLLYSEVK